MVLGRREETSIERQRDCRTRAEWILERLWVVGLYFVRAGTSRMIVITQAAHRGASIVQTSLELQGLAVNQAVRTLLADFPALGSCSLTALPPAFKLSAVS